MYITVWKYISLEYNDYQEEVQQTERLELNLFLR